jgi:hypothetical protein
MIMATTPVRRFRRGQGERNAAQEQALDSATTEPALTPSSVIVRTSGACSPTSDSSAPTVRMSLVAEMNTDHEEQLELEADSSLRATIVLTSSRMTTMKSAS